MCVEQDASLQPQVRVIGRHTVHTTTSRLAQDRQDQAYVSQLSATAQMRQHHRRMSRVTSDLVAQRLVAQHGAEIAALRNRQQHMLTQELAKELEATRKAAMRRVLRCLRQGELQRGWSAWWAATARWQQQKTVAVREQLLRSAAAQQVSVEAQRAKAEEQAVRESKCAALQLARARAEGLALQGAEATAAEAARERHALAQELEEQQQAFHDAQRELRSERLQAIAVLKEELSSERLGQEELRQRHAAVLAKRESDAQQSLAQAVGEWESAKRAAMAALETQQVADLAAVQAKQDARRGAAERHAQALSQQAELLEERLAAQGRQQEELFRAQAAQAAEDAAALEACRAATREGQRELERQHAAARAQYKEGTLAQLAAARAKYDSMLVASTDAHAHELAAAEAAAQAALLVLKEREVEEEGNQARRKRTRERRQRAHRQALEANEAAATQELDAALAAAAAEQQRAKDAFQEALSAERLRQEELRRQHTKALLRRQEAQAAERETAEKQHAECLAAVAAVRWHHQRTSRVLAHLRAQRQSAVHHGELSAMKLRTIMAMRAAHTARQWLGCAWRRWRAQNSAASLGAAMLAATERLGRPCACTAAQTAQMSHQYTRRHATTATR